VTGPAAPPSDLPTRFAMGVAMIAVASLLTYFGGWPFRILATLAAAIMLVEYAALRGVARHWAWVGGLFAAIMLLGVAEYYYPVAADVIDMPRLDSFAAALGLALLLGLASRRPVMAWGFLYVVVPSFALVVMSGLWFALVFWVMVVTWATDIFAYFAGRSIGGPKLAPRLSPNKTWAGLIGGMAGAALCGWLGYRLFHLDALFPWTAWAGAPMAIVAQAGDLYESWEKRRAGVKDSGTLLPGHGGVLDRLDGMLAVSVATIAVLMLTDVWAG
jgi:phosphatidate cytidylyltransferase